MSRFSLERRIADLFGYDHAVLFGRARAGLVAVLECVGPAGPVAIPSNLCPAIPAAIAAAGARALLVPVSPRSGLADDVRMLAAMAGEAHPGVVMPTHLYGLWSPYSATCAEARRHGWFVLENDTLCAASRRNGRRIAIGDALLVSFAMVKTIEAGIGGAVLTDDPALARELAARAHAWPSLGPADEEVDAHLTLARRHLRALGRPGLAEQLLDIDAAHTRHALPGAARPRIEQALAAMPGALERRRERLAAWRTQLTGIADHFPEPEAELMMPWRHVRRLKNPNLRPPLLEALRAQGFDAGTNFPPLREGFPSLSSSPDPEDGGIRWGETVVNLWLTDDYNHDRIAAAAAVIRRVIDKGTP